ncbi:MAG: GntR family transcriptional regulator [Pseudomonadota bacterium]
MKLVVRRNSPLSVKDQIKRQIRIMIDGKELMPGQALPSAKDLANILNVNRNTVAGAYRELAAEGILKTVVGSGTFVREDIVTTSTDALREIFDEAFDKAVAAGFSPDGITDFLLGAVTTRFGSIAGARVLVVECNQPGLETISRALRTELSVKTTDVLIQHLESSPQSLPELLSEADLIVCGLNHVEDLRKITPVIDVEIVGVLFKPHIQVMNELLRLPRGTKVGLTCVNQRSTESFFKEIILSGGSSLCKMWAGQDNVEGLRNLVDQCRVIFATNFVYERIVSMAAPGTRVVKVNLSLDRANLDLVRERLLSASGTSARRKSG